MRRRLWRHPGVVGLVALALLATSCRGGDTGDDNGGTGTGNGSAEEGNGDIATDIGATSDPCPEAVNEDNGCIYLGTLSDLTVGPFAGISNQIVAGQSAFWQRVNEEGGIGGYDVDSTTYIRDNQYSPEVTAQVFTEIQGDVLALAQTLGSPQTAAILEGLINESVVAVPASWTSGWLFEDIILETGTSYCFDAMNAVDYAVESSGVGSVLAVHYPGDYGEDGAAGASIAAEANELEFSSVETIPGAENQAAAVSAILAESPDLVFLTVAPAETAAIVGGAAAEGFQGRFIGSAPTWNQALLESPAAPALQAAYQTVGPWEAWSADTPGHEALRETVGEPDDLNDGYTFGWVWSYALKAALEAAAESGDLTRAGLLAAVTSLETVDFEGMLPEEAGNHVGEPDDVAFRQSVISAVDPDAATGLSTVEGFFAGPTAEGYALEAPCYETAEL